MLLTKDGGSVTWLSHFIPDLAKICKPLQQLPKKDICLLWTPTLRLKITNDFSIQLFDPKLSVYIEIDASKQGLRAVLLQQDSAVKNDAECDKIPTNLRPVTCVAKSLSAIDNHNTNIEKELLGVLFSL